MEPLFSADSHVVETEEAFADIEPKFRERRPRQGYDAKMGAVVTVPGLDYAIPAGFMCRAGRPFETWGQPLPWSELHPASRAPMARLAIQDEEASSRRCSTRASAW